MKTGCDYVRTHFCGNVVTKNLLKWLEEKRESGFKMEKYKISVIVPAHNAEATLERCILSITGGVYEY